MVQLMEPAIQSTMLPVAGAHFSRLLMFDFTRNLYQMFFHSGKSTAPCVVGVGGGVVDIGEEQSWTSVDGHVGLGDAELEPELKLL